MTTDFKLVKDGLETLPQSWSYWPEESLVTAPYPWPGAFDWAASCIPWALPLWCVSQMSWSLYLSTLCFCMHSHAPISRRIFTCSLSWYCAYGNVMQTPEPSWLPTDRCIYYRNESNLPQCLMIWGLALLGSVPVPFFALNDNWLIERIYYHDKLGTLSEVIKAIIDAGIDFFIFFFIFSITTLRDVECG